MSSRRALERRLATLAGFRTPTPDLEQYATPPDIAAHVLHRADLSDDLEGTVVDLGTGTGILALGAALRRARRVIGIDRDFDALEVARRNERRLAPPTAVDWLHGDAGRSPLCVDDVTVVMNPPFGAQRANVHADRPFLATTADIAAVSYSIHNAGSRDFVESFAGDYGGTVTAAFEARIDLPRQFAFHGSDRRELTVEVFRIAWDHR